MVDEPSEVEPDEQAAFDLDPTERPVKIEGRLARGRLWSGLVIFALLVGAGVVWLRPGPSSESASTEGSSETTAPALSTTTTTEQVATTAPTTTVLAETTTTTEIEPPPVDAGPAPMVENTIPPVMLEPDPPPIPPMHDIALTVETVGGLPDIYCPDDGSGCVDKPTSAALRYSCEIEAPGGWVQYPLAGQYVQEMALHGHLETFFGYGYEGLLVHCSFEPSQDLAVRINGVPYQGGTVTHSVDMAVEVEYVGPWPYLYTLGRDGQYLPLWE